MATQLNRDSGQCTKSLNKNTEEKQQMPLKIKQIVIRTKTCCTLPNGNIAVPDLSARQKSQVLTAFLKACQVGAKCSPNHQGIYASISGYNLM